MRAYIKCISFLQTFLVGGSVAYLMSAPIVLSYYPFLLPENSVSTLFFISLVCVTFVMAIRPLADLVPGVRYIRPLVILRKGFGVLSASIIVGFMFSKILSLGLSSYLGGYVTPAYWSLNRYALIAHLGDLAAIVLLVTSNNYSKRVLGFWWKRIQKLAYLYFYAGATYEWLVFDSVFALGAMCVVTVLVVSAWHKNTQSRRKK